MSLIGEMQAHMWASDKSGRERDTLGRNEFHGRALYLHITPPQLLSAHKVHRLICYMSLQTVRASAASL